MAPTDRLRGMVAQSMSGRKFTGQPTVVGYASSTSPGSLTVAKDCFALLGAWGAGQAGDNAITGGDGGDAVFALVRLKAGWIINWTPGAPGAHPAGPGGDTVINYPGGQLLARGGGSASANFGPYVSKGGKGGVTTVGGTGADGGGVGGSGSGPGGGGGGAGLLSKFAALVQGEPGGNGDGGAGAQNGAAPGGGGGSNNLAGTPGDGGGGGVVVLLIRVSN